MEESPPNLVNYTILLWVLLFIMMVYAMRGKETTGFLFAFAEIIAMLLIFAVLYSTKISGVLVWLGSTFIIMLYALKIDWFGCSKRYGFLFLIYPLFFLWLIVSMPYRINRILVLFTPYDDPLGWGYVPCQILDVMQNASFLGSGGVNLAYLTEHLPNMHTDYILTTALSHWGWLSIVVVLLSYGVFFALCFMACKKVKSQMGRFVIVAITSCWVLQFVSYLIINFTTLQMSTYPLLFVQGGYMRMINLFLLGIVLSVYSAERHCMEGNCCGEIRKTKQSILWLNNFLSGCVGWIHSLFLFTCDKYRLSNFFRMFSIFT
ncbi:MAG: FtsW/RodA/SpoVE family cell cycle protein [Peptococcaceae bacterium]|nr:FtsW/RodA/SpoVE family cell cycle protein [Peptococcaceae bacterium]